MNNYKYLNILPLLFLVFLNVKPKPIFYFKLKYKLNKSKELHKLKTLNFCHNYLLKVNKKKYAKSK